MTEAKKNDRSLQQQDVVTEDRPLMSSKNSPSPSAAGIYVPANFGREVSNNMLHVSPLDQSIGEAELTRHFQSIGTVVSIRLLPDKSRREFSYAFVEYEDESSAQEAIEKLNNKELEGHPLRVNWAYQTQQAIKDNDNNFNIFVGDLAGEVNDEMLAKAFGQLEFTSILEARVMWDMSTGRSRGYGFVSFRDRNEAERALEIVDGMMIGSRAVRCNWAQKGIKKSKASSGSAVVETQQPLAFQNPYSMIPGQSHVQPHPYGAPPALLSYEVVLNQSPPWQTTVYLGNLPPFMPTQALIPLMKSLGYVLDLKHQQDKGYAFVKYDSHEAAAMVIIQLTGYHMNGRIIRVGWGKTNTTTNIFQGVSVEPRPEESTVALPT